MTTATPAAENGTRVARIRAAAEQARGPSRLAAHQGNANAAVRQEAAGSSRKSDRAVAPASPTATTKAPAPKREPWKVPADVVAKGAGAEIGYRITFEAVSEQLARMSKIPAAQGRIGSLIEMVASGSSDADIRRDLAAMPTDRQRQISATWDRAISSVYASRGMALSIEGDANGPQPSDAARQRMIAVANDDLFIGNEAKALTHLTKEGLYGLNAADLLDVLAISTGSDRTAEATWDRAHAAVFGAAASGKSDPHGWHAIHADIRERRG